MRWYGCWWGIVLMADDDKDEEALKAFAKLLPPSAASSYDDGICELQRGPFVDDYGDEEKCLTFLEFKR